MISKTKFIHWILFLFVVLGHAFGQDPQFPLGMGESQIFESAEQDNKSDQSVLEVYQKDRPTGSSISLEELTSEDESSLLDDVSSAPSIHVAPLPRFVPLDAGTSFSAPDGGRYTILKRLGKGGMGVVVLAKKAGETSPRVFKMAPSQNDRFDTRLIQSFLITRRLIERHAPTRVRELKDFIQTEIGGVTHFAIELQDLPQPVGKITSEGLSRKMSLDKKIITEHIRQSQNIPADKPVKFQDIRQETDKRIKLIKKFVSDVMTGMKEMHEAGIVHRDLKLDNIMASGSVEEILAGKAHFYIIDMGLIAAYDNEAKVTFDETFNYHGTELRGAGDLDRRGSAIGTPNYMPLEQMLDSSRVDPINDYFSLGMMLFELLVGGNPHTSNDQLPYPSSFDILERNLSILGRIFDTGVQKKLDSVLKDIAGYQKQDIREVVELTEVLLNRDPLARFNQINTINQAAQKVTTPSRPSLVQRFKNCVMKILGID